VEKMDEKLKSENMQKRAVFRKVENSAILTTYLFRYALECTIS